MPDERLPAPTDRQPAIALAALDHKIRKMLSHARAESTDRAYRHDWTHFAAWCQDLDLQALPADPRTVAGYVADLADPAHRVAYRPSTIARRLAAISDAHQLARQPNPTRDPLVRETMAGIRRMLLAVPQRKQALRPDELAAIVDQLGDRLIDHRDRALLLLGFAGGFRRSELVGVRVEDLTFCPDGLLVEIRTSKTDQEGRGRTVPIAPGLRPSTCPVLAVRRWITEAEISQGPLLRPVKGTQALEGHLGGRSVALILKRHARHLPGVDPGHLAGHSLRRGMVTTAAANGVPEHRIMASTGHTAVRTLREGYIAAGHPLADPPSAHLDL